MDLTQFRKPVNQRKYGFAFRTKSSSPFSLFFNPRSPVPTPFTTPTRSTYLLPRSSLSSINGSTRRPLTSTLFPLPCPCLSPSPHCVLSFCCCQWSSTTMISSVGFARPHCTKGFDRISPPLNSSPPTTSPCPSAASPRTTTDITPLPFARAHPPHRGA